MFDAAGTLARGLQAHLAGDMAAAAAAYRAVLAADPTQAEALHGLGVITYRQGRAAEAAGLLQGAVARAPERAEFWFNLGLALLAAGAAADAVAAFESAARLRPEWPEAQYDLGNARRTAGDLAGAARAFRQALKLRPGYVHAEVNLANVLKDEGKLDQALAAYRRVLARNPNLPETQNNLGAALVEAGDRRGAEAAFRAALAGKPDFPAAMANLGSLLQAEGDERRKAEARRMFQAAAALIGPQAGPETLLLLGECRLGMRDFAGAVAALRKAVGAFPESAPESWRARLDLAEALRQWGRLEEADLALPETVPAAARLRLLLARGALRRDQQRLEEAAADCRAALRLAPKSHLARYNLGHALLTAGKLAEGFAAFEARVELARPRQPPGRAWEGGNPRGRHLLVVSEEGLGDTIQFARFLPRLARAGARVTLMTAPALLRLFGSLEGGIELVSDRGAPPRADGWALLMSLPRLLGLGDLAVLGAPYLRGDGDATARFASLLPAGGLRVGIAWAGSPTYGVDHLRSCPPAGLAPLMAVPGVQWVSLQLGAAADALPGARLAVFDGDIKDMADTAALIGALDLVISVDTGVAHLAGALGKPVWLLNRFNTCWRWQTGADDSIWYGSMRQFRQSVPGEWGEPVARMAEALRGLTA